MKSSGSATKTESAFCDPRVFGRRDGKSLGYIHDVVWQLVRWGKILEDRQIKADIAANGLETALKRSTRKVTPPAV